MNLNFRSQRFVASLVIILVALFSFSCNKSDIEAPLIEEKVAEINQSDDFTGYYIDDVEVDPDAFASESSDMLLVDFYVPKSSIKSSSAVEEDIQNVAEKRAYSSEEKYIEFGESIGLNFKAQLDFEKTMREYVEKTGVIEEYEKTGEVPARYVEYEKSVYNSIIKAGTKSKIQRTASLYIELYEDDGAKGRWIPLSGTYPVMPPTWNNTVSSVLYIGSGGAITIFDKAFYFKKIRTVAGIGLIQNHNLPNDCNDKMSSVIQLL